MNGMERLKAAMAGEPADRIPVFCNLLDQGARELGMSIEKYYSKGENVAKAQLMMRERYGYDCLWSLFYVGKEAELLGCGKMVFAYDGPPNVGEMVIREFRDIEKLQIPDDVYNLTAFREELKCLEILKAESDGKYPVCAYLTSSLTLPALLMGMEKWMELLVGGPVELRDQLLAKCCEFFRKQMEAYRRAGADVLLYSNPFGSTDFIPLSLIDELSVPWMERDLANVDTSGVVYYCGGARVNRVISRVSGKLGLRAFYLSPMDDVAAAKREVGTRGLTCGTINDIRLIDWSPAEVRREVERIIKAGKPGGRFLFGTLVMPYSIPEENIKTMLSAAFEFGAIEEP